MTWKETSRILNACATLKERLDKISRNTRNGNNSTQTCPNSDISAQQMTPQRSKAYRCHNATNKALPALLWRDSLAHAVFTDSNACKVCKAVVCPNGKDIAECVPRIPLALIAQKQRYCKHHSCRQCHINNTRKGCRHIGNRVLSLTEQLADKDARNGHKQIEQRRENHNLSLKRTRNGKRGKECCTKAKENNCKGNAHNSLWCITAVVAQIIELPSANSRNNRHKGYITPRREQRSAKEHCSKASASKDAH